MAKLLHSLSDSELRSAIAEVKSDIETRKQALKELEAEEDYRLLADLDATDSD